MNWILCIHLQRGPFYLILYFMTSYLAAAPVLRGGKEARLEDVNVLTSRQGTARYLGLSWQINCFGENFLWCYKVNWSFPTRNYVELDWSVARGAYDLGCCRVVVCLAPKTNNSTTIIYDVSLCIFSLWHHQQSRQVSDHVWDVSSCNLFFILV